MIGLRYPAACCGVVQSAVTHSYCLPSMPLVLNQRPTDFYRGFKVFEHRLINFAQVPPRVFIAVEAVEKQHIRQQAEHPIDVRRVADYRAATGAFKKLFGEALAVTAFEHAACGEINEIGFYAKVFEGIAERLFADGFKNRFYFGRRAVKGEIKNRRVDGAGIAPEQTSGRCGVMGEAALGLDEAVGELQRRIVERSHRLKEAFDGHGLKKAIVPVGFQDDELGGHSPPAIDARPGRMSRAGAGREPLRRFFRATFDAAMAAHRALAVVTRERFIRLDIMLPVTDVGRHEELDSWSDGVLE